MQNGNAHKSFGNRIDCKNRFAAYRNRILDISQTIEPRFNYLTISDNRQFQTWDSPFLHLTLNKDINAVGLGKC
ncbi:hypothetical protein CHRYSEO8AT_780017 [Chryseobacterium sp. 8AT]|nr:hypothetical protein CHRYSEO8AT_780017 [Chryseobacterium sp. 8AT]